VACRGWRIVLDTALGIAALHGFNIVHLDIRSANVLLLSSQLGGKLTDFGLARILDDARFPPSTTFGAFQYAAPEVVLSGGTEVGHPSMALPYP
jgi:eukaryotic-like serine/threonine-protein kinase